MINKWFIIYQHIIHKTTSKPQIHKFAVST